jgi:hypothetical protein
LKITDPAAVKVTAAASIRTITPPAPADAPAIKIDAPAIKFDSPASARDTAPAIKFDSAVSGQMPSVPLSDRSIPGNSLIVSAGFGDLVDVVQRAGAIKLVVV